MAETKFEWELPKDLANQLKHGIPFGLAQYAFSDVDRVITEDVSHSQNEQRYFCFGEVHGRIMTVRFTYRKHIIRIFGAGYWRKGRTIYDKENRL